MKCGSQIFQYGLESLPIWQLDSRDPQSLVFAIYSLLLMAITITFSWHLSPVFYSCHSHNHSNLDGHNPLIAGDRRYSITQFNSPALHQLESGSRQSNHLFFFQRTIPTSENITVLKVCVASGQPGDITEKTKVINLTPWNLTKCLQIPFL